MLYVLIVVLIILDQLFKFLISQNIPFMEVHPVIPGFFSLTNVMNNGGAFSLLAEQKWGIYVLTAISAIVSVVLLIILIRLRGKNYNLIRLVLALVTAGTIGNMIDRIRLGSVLDFLMFKFGSYVFPVFNFADMCIVVGSISLALLIFFDKRILAGKADKKMAEDDNEAFASTAEDKKST
jgi:signal peptidase II